MSHKKHDSQKEEVNLQTPGFQVHEKLDNFSDTFTPGVDNVMCLFTVCLLLSLIQNLTPSLLKNLFKLHNRIWLNLETWQLSRATSMSNRQTISAILHQFKSQSFSYFYDFITSCFISVVYKPQEHPWTLWPSHIVYGCHFKVCVIFFMLYWSLLTVLSLLVSSDHRSNALAQSH